MLVLTRKESETVVIGDGVRVRIEEIRGGKVRLGIEAEPDVRILRAELVTRDTKGAGQ